MIEPISVVIKKILQKLTGSLNINMPINAVPTAPIPVHTAYAVPIGSVWVAFMSNNILTVNEIKNPPYHTYTALPVASLAFPKQDANATSKSPAIIKIIQIIAFSICRKAQGLNGGIILQMVKNETFI